MGRSQGGGAEQRDLGHGPFTRGTKPDWVIAHVFVMAMDTAAHGVAGGVIGEAEVVGVALGPAFAQAGVDVVAFRVAACAKIIVTHQQRMGCTR